MPLQGSERKKLARFHTSHGLLDYILEQSELVDAVRRLEPLALMRLIEHVGLEDAGELAALATTEQLERVFDEDLWKSERPGIDERFDAERFGLWICILVEQGVAFAARKLSEIDEDLVTLGLCRHLLVIDIEQLAQRMTSEQRGIEDDQLDKVLESCLYHEFEQYRVISRDHATWDAILAWLVELNTHDYAALARLLDRCCDICSETIEENGGLYQVLTSDEMLEADVAAEREGRREREGYVAPSAALSFLKLARLTSLEEIEADCERDPITRAHFREAKSEPRPASRRSPGARGDAAQRRGLERLFDALRAADVLPNAERPRALSANTSGKAEMVLTSALRAARERDGALYATRALELAYLANVLLSGCGTRLRSLRPAEAAEAALAVCNLGAERALEQASKGYPKDTAELLDFVRDSDLVKLFRVGFHLLCRKEPPAAVTTTPALKLLRSLMDLKDFLPMPV
ncbi:MAG: hypothetical protein JXA30_13565 [Deltaproteobacteria bacterium]|nr:hypothetical protein [Deltaproteobacteria bacterium]